MIDNCHLDPMRDTFKYMKGLTALAAIQHIQLDILNMMLNEINE